MKYLAGWVLTLALMGCEAKLERQGVPIAWLVRVNAAEAPPSTAAWLDSTARPPGNIVVFELLIRRQGPDLWQLSEPDMVQLETLVQKARQRGLTPWVGIRLQALDGSFSIHQDELKVALINGTRFALWELTHRPTLRNLPLICTDLPAGLYPLEDSAGVTSASSAARRAMSDCVPIGPQLIAITRDPGGEHKAAARTTHPRLAAEALRCKQSVVLGPLYLGGRDRLVQLKNALRFWPDSLRIHALIIGTTEPVPAWADSLSPFGLARADADTDELREWLQEYAIRSRPK
jgi:hypothetical protein